MRRGRTSASAVADPVTCQESPDPRDHGARLWDALVQTAQHSLDTDFPPESHGTKPRIVELLLVTDADDAAVPAGLYAATLPG